MITLLVGENSFEVDRELERLVDQFSGTPEKIDGSELELRSVADLLMGGSLFAEKRLVIIRNLSANPSIWNMLGEWVGRLSDDTNLILIEAKPDRRTKTYKNLQKQATIQEYKPWNERDVHMAQRWAIDEAKRLGFKLDSQAATRLVNRTGADQWRLFYALNKLRVLGEVDSKTIDDVVELHPAENVFLLFETALRGNAVRLGEMIRTLEQTEDAHKVFGLLVSQVFQLAVMALGQRGSHEVAADLGTKSFALQKIAPFAAKLSRTQVRRLVRIFADTDRNIKCSHGDPWVLIEAALLDVASI